MKWSIISPTAFTELSSGFKDHLFAPARDSRSGFPLGARLLPFCSGERAVSGNCRKSSIFHFSNSALHLKEVTSVKTPVEMFQDHGVHVSIRFHLSEELFPNACLFSIEMRFEIKSLFHRTSRETAIRDSLAHVLHKDSRCGKRKDPIAQNFANRRFFKV